MTGMVRDQTALLRLVEDELASLGGDVSDVHPFAAGLEFAVFAGSSRTRRVVVKAPWTRQIANANDPDQDARDLIRQEAELLAFARSAGVPAPEVVLLHVDGAVDLLVTELVPDDGSQPSGEQLAAALARLHEAPAPALRLVAQQGAFHETIAERTGRRAGVVERLAGVRLGLPPVAELMALIGPGEGAPSLLHLDVREANVLTERGRITGLIDWTNALLGDPALELARIAEYGSAPPGFLDAYAKHRPVVPGGARELIYRLDAAVMLAVVFLSEAPDEARARPQVARACELADALREELRS
jgi:aminoglycoside phosphotransferase (APT) family kinase protein